MHSRETSVPLCSHFYRRNGLKCTFGRNLSRYAHLFTDGTCSKCTPRRNPSRYAHLFADGTCSNAHSGEFHPVMRTFLQAERAHMHIREKSVPLCSHFTDGTCSNQTHIREKSVPVCSLFYRRNGLKCTFGKNLSPSAPLFNGGTVSKRTTRKNPSRHAHLLPD